MCVLGFGSPSLSPATDWFSGMGRHAERQTLLRQQFIDALSQAMQVDFATSTRADVIFAIGQRARPSRSGRG